MNISWGQVLRGVVTASLFLGWLVAAHLGSAGVGNADVNLAVAVIPLLVAGAMACNAYLTSLWAWMVALVLVLGLWLLWPLLRSNVPLMYYLQHLGTHLALASLFGRSLIGQGDALITSMARFIFGDQLSDRKVHYTRQLTLVWTLFFLGNSLVSTILFVWAPVQWWSVHANLLTGPLIGLVFVVEHFVRQRVLPPHERPKFKDIVRAYQQRRSLDDGKAISRS